MRLLPAPRDAGRIPYPMVFGTLTLLAAAAAWIRLSPALEWIPSLCLFRRLTGFPCPACHGTRALATLATGRIGPALALNPLVTLLALASLLLALVSVIRRISGLPLLRVEMGSRETAGVRAAAVALVAANWIYLVASR